MHFLFSFVVFLNVGSEHCGVVRMVMLMNIYLLWLLYVDVICWCICLVGGVCVRDFFVFG